MPFLPPNQQRQSTEGFTQILLSKLFYTQFFLPFFICTLQVLFEIWQSIDYSFNYWHIFYPAVYNSPLFPDSPANSAFSLTFPDKSNSRTFPVFPDA